MDEIQKRLVNSMQQLRREMAAAGVEMPDCLFSVIVRDGEIHVNPIEDANPDAGDKPTSKRRAKN